jgi:single-stranded DNA-binding protein
VIDVLAAGKLIGAAVERTASSGKIFVTCKLRVADSDGEAQFINVVAFDDSVKSALLALGDGGSVSVSGAMKVSTYETRDGTTRISMNVVASAVLTPYHAKRQRDAVEQASGSISKASAVVGGVRKQRGQRNAAALPDNANCSQRGMAGR